MAKTEAANYIKVTQVKSAIGRIEPQKRTIKALGLGKISSSSVLPDNTAVRGMVASVAHLVKVEEAPKPKAAQKSGSAEAQKQAPKVSEAKPAAVKKPAAAKKPVAQKVKAQKAEAKKTTVKKESK